MTTPSEPTTIDAAALLEALDEGVLVLDGGRVRAANAALARMAGLRVAELVGRSLGELLTDAEGVPLQGLASQDGARLRDGQGGLVPVSLRRVDAELAIVIDRSRERRLEQEVWRLAGHESREPGRGLVASEIAGMIEHEIGTAATLVGGNLRLLLDERAGALGEQQRSFLLEARRASERIGRLARDLLEVASAHQPGALRVLRKPERLAELIEAAVAQSRPLFDEREMGLELEIELERDLLSLDAMRVEQVLANLLSNAAKFAPAGSTVRVGAHEFEDDTGASVSVSVIDEGPGVSTEEAEEIFEPFVRGTSAETSGAPGLGLGLAVCHAIAVAHGGRAEALPSLGYGHFRLVLPLD